ncbi:MAG: efflux transporter outer membrane subunit [Alphaproteobacteria bacterium]|nr:efflux transporter outer membrane subunit [Alphaproteobacteria bacterium]
MRKSPPKTAAVLAAALLSACTVGPDYERPGAPVPLAYKEAGWKVGEPRDGIDRGPWWTVFNDPVLSQLEDQVAVSNQTLKADEAAFRQAQAVVAEARAGFFPTFGISGSAQRTGNGGGGSSRGSISGGTLTSGGAAVTQTGGGSGGRVQNVFDVSGNASWVPDLWGRIRRTVEGDIATAQVSAADLAAARLTIEAQLATDYFEIRIADELQRLLDSSVAAFKRSLQITRNQHAAGIASLADVANADTQVKTTQAQAIAVGNQRAQLEHAIAALIGKPPAELSIAPAPFPAALPTIPPGVPSSLLERRPDIAAAERQMAATNAQIGVATAAFYPDLTLTASGGFTAPAIGQLLQASNSLWSIGSSLAETVFDGGLRTAQVAAARAAYDQSVANYRQIVLTGFQQVEDELSALRILTQQADAEAAAVASAREAERLTLNQYKAGTVAYTSVIVAQTTALNNAQTALNVFQSRLTASVALIQALGGGWSAEQLPNAVQVEAGAP